MISSGMILTFIYWGLSTSMSRESRLIRILMVENMNRNGEIIKQPKMQILAKTRECGFTFNFVLFEYEVLAIHFWCMYAMDMGGFSLTQLFSSQGTGLEGFKKGNQKR